MKKRTSVRKSPAGKKVVRKSKSKSPVRKSPAGKKVVRKSKSKSPVRKASVGCVKQSTKKYSSRPSPPYPAQECRGQQKQGNDGQLYESVANVKGVFSWKLVKSAPAKREIVCKGGKCYIKKRGEEIFDLYVKFAPQIKPLRSQLVGKFNQLYSKLKAEGQLNYLQEDIMDILLQHDIELIITEKQSETLMKLVEKI